MVNITRRSSDLSLVMFGNNDNIKYIEFGSINKPVTIEITPEDVGNLLLIEVKYRYLISIKWKEKVDKGDYFITHFRNAVPGHFFMRCGSSKIL